MKSMDAVRTLTLSMLTRFKALPIAIFIVAGLGGCASYPLNTQDQSRALGKGNFRVGTAIHLVPWELNAAVGISDSTDIFAQLGTTTSLGFKQTIFDKPGEVGVALLAGGFVSSRYSREEEGESIRGRDTGGFLGSTINWFDGNFTYAVQLRHNVIDHHAVEATQFLDFLLLDRFRQITQLGLIARWQKPDSNWSVKGGIDCARGFDRLPDRLPSDSGTFESGADLLDEPQDVQQGFCLPIFGINYTTSRAGK